MLLVLGWGRSASGHGLALPFAFWGNFSVASVRCQRVLGAAAAWCGLGVWKVRAGCLGPLLDGGSCEVTANDGQAQQFHLRALDLIDRRCTSPEAQALGFLLKFEAQADMDNFCHQLETAMVSAVYGPVMSGALVPAADRVTQQCVDGMARAATTVLRYAVHQRQRALDVIAARNLSPSDKQALIDQGTARIERLRDRLTAEVSAECPAGEFGTIYGPTPSALLDAIGQRADCLAGAVYVQSGVVCPLPVCGNGVQEVGEQCDDGNQNNNDSCRNDCTANP